MKNAHVVRGKNINIVAVRLPEKADNTSLAHRIVVHDRCPFFEI